MKTGDVLSDEGEYIRENWKKKTDRQVGIDLDRSFRTVHQWRLRNGLRHKQNPKPWTSEQDQLLCRLFKDEKLSIHEIADRVGRSVASVRLRGSRTFGLFRSDRHVQEHFRPKDFYHSLKCTLGRKTAGASCCICGYSKHIDLHHIDGQRVNHHISNIASLCPNNHHREVEALECEGIPLFSKWWMVYSNSTVSRILTNRKERGLPE